jgi:TonB family protein
MAHNLRNTKKMVKIKRIVFTLIALMIFSLNSEAQNISLPDTIIEWGDGAVEILPSFIKGDIESFIDSVIVYPYYALQDSIEGTVFVLFIVDTNGTTYNHRILKGIREDIDLEALRVARLLRFENPAMQRDKPIKIKYYLPIKFVINRIETDLFEY